MSEVSNLNRRRFAATAFMSNTCIARLWLATMIVAGLASTVQPRASADGPSRIARDAVKPTIVLVHGAFADGSSWSKVISVLEKDGYSVTAVQNPLSSLADDIAVTKRVIDAQPGPVVVVAHSYGGAVITGAAAGNANVKALVYIAAFAPDNGEKVTAGSEKYAPAPLNSALVPDSAGFLYVDRAKFHENVCADLSEAEARLMAATQKPIAGSAFDDTVASAAWKSIPSWYIVATEDHAINPDLERFLAKRMGAKTTELKSSHVAYISHPREVALLIEQAASAARRK